MNMQIPHKMTNEEAKTQAQYEILKQIKQEPSVKKLPPQTQKNIANYIFGIEQRIIKTHSGPIPCPDDLAQYNNIIPNGAERIMMMAEKQQEHRISIEGKIVNSQQNQSRLGQVFGFVIAIFFGLIAGILIYNGHDIAGTVIGSVDLVALVAVFVTGKYTQKKSLNENK